MGSVFSAVQSPFRLVESVLRMGVAAAAAFAFYPFNPYYYHGLLAILPYCEPAEIEPFEDFSAALDDLCDEAQEKGLNSINIPSPPSRPLSPLTTTQPVQSTIWKSPTVEVKKRLKIAAAEAQRKAPRFHRHYRLYGPPDWTDPAASLLPPSCLLPGAFMPNMLPSVFPFAAPHIVLTPPPYDRMDPLIATANSIQRQDQAYGNRLIVSEPPTLSGPHPVIINATPCRPAPRIAEKTDKPDERRSDDEISDVPSLADDVSGYESSDCEALDESGWTSTSVKEGSSWDLVQPGKNPAFWIEEDEEGLPDLPENW